jgi:hypothetical protein
VPIKVLRPQKRLAIEFIEVLYVTAAYFHNYAKNGEGTIPKELVPKVRQWAPEAVSFLRKHSVPIRNFQKWVNSIVSGTYQNEDGLVVLADFFKDLRSGFRNIQRDPEVTHNEIAVMKALRGWIKSGRASAYRNLQKGIGLLQLDPSIVSVFRTESGSQEPIRKQLKPLVKLFTGRENTNMTLEERMKAKDKNRDKYREFLKLRKALVDVYNNELRNYVRDRNGKPQPVAEVKRHMQSNGIEDRLPDGFAGLVDEHSVLYTSGGKPIDGYVDRPVKMNPSYDPDKDDQYVFTAVTDAGATQHFYTTTYREQKKTEKYSNVADLINRSEVIRKKWLKDLKSDEETRYIPAAMMEIVYLTAQRIGTPGNKAGGQATYGLSTLLVGHVKKRGNSILFDYLGKDGVRHKHMIKAETLETKRIVQIITELMAGKKRADPLFTTGTRDYNARMINSYFRRLAGSKVHIHNIRHMRGTKLASEILENSPLLSRKVAVQQTEAERWFKQAMTKVGSLLGHVRGVGTLQKITPGTAIKSYIDPELSRDFFRKLNLRIPKWLMTKNAGA